MHQALKLPEIFELILFYLHDPRERSHPRPDHRLRPGKYQLEISTINSLAQTCKHFSKPSLDVLWYYQRDIKPLLKCLPNDLLECRTTDYDEELILKRAFKREDFDRVDQYGHRIRILEEDGSGVTEVGEDIDVMIYPIIVSRRSHWELGPLLPNLVHLKMYFQRFCDLAWYPRLVIGPQLRFLNLIVFRKDLEQLDIHWRNMFTALSPVLPSLNTISFSALDGDFFFGDGDIYRFDASSRDQEVLLKIVQTISSPTVLDVISLPLGAQAISHIAGLQTIEVLAISIYDIEANELQNLPELPNLLELQLEGQDSGFCSTIIRQLGPKNLRALKVIRMMSEDTWDIDRFIESLRASRFVSTLDGIEVITPNYRTEPDPDIPPITQDTIRQLSHFKKLRSIRLSLTGEVHLDVEALEDIASLWPNLQVLDLRTRTRLGDVDPRVGLHDLLVVLTKLPFLKEVRLQVNASKELTYETSALPASGIAAPELETFDVCTSPISDSLVKVVATLLGAAFPNLRILSYGWQWPNGNGDDVLDVDLSRNERISLESWETVATMLNLER